MANEHWAKQRERGSYFGIKLLLIMYRYGGKWLVTLGLFPIMLYFYATAGQTRRASKDYLTRVFTYFGPTHALPKEPGWTVSFHHFWQFAKAALDKVDAWVGDIQLSDLTLGRIEEFEQAVKEGHGAVLVTSHIGNIEICRALVKQRFSMRMNVLVFTQHAVRFNRILKEVNSDVDVDLIQAVNITPDLVIMLKDRIESGESVVIVGDRVAVDAPAHVMWADFLGAPAPFAIGPWILASVLECPVYFMSCVLDQDSYRLDIEPFKARLKLPRQGRKERLHAIVQAYAHHLEALVRDYPLQWYNFYNFWCLPDKNHKKKGKDVEYR